jgi:hypothetical protein
MKMLAALALPLLSWSAAMAQPQDEIVIGDARITATSEPEAVQRLRRNSGITLQWIGWDRRGRLEVRDVNGSIELHGMQQERAGPGRLTLDGRVIFVARNHLRFQGRIVITDTPDVGRNCERDGMFDFVATGRRRYWRLQQMEACDGLTDYVDIYY